MNELKIVNEWANDCDYVRGAAISPDSKVLVTHHPNAIGIWELPSGKLVAKVVMDDLGYRDGIDDMAVDFAHERLACWNGANVPGKRFLRVVDLVTGQTIKSRKVEECIQSAAFDPGGKFLVTGESKGQRTPVRVWSADSLKEINGFEGHTNNVDYVAISPNGLLLATACFYREWQRLDDLYLWDLRGMRLKCRLTAPDGNFSGLYWSPDGTRLFAGLYKRAAVWETGGFKRTDIDEQLLAVSPGNSYAAFLRYDGRGGKFVCVWSLKQMRFVSEARQDQGVQIHTTTVSADGTMLLTKGDGDGSALWDAKSGLPVSHFSGMSPEVFSPTNDCILAEAGKSSALQGKRSLVLIRCPTGDEREALLVEARRVEEEKLRQRAEETRRAEEERLRKQAEAEQVAEQERMRKEAEEKRRAEEERLRKQVEAERVAEQERMRKEAEEKRRDYEARKSMIQDRRRKAAQCVMCGQPLGWIDRLLRRDRHGNYESFAE